LKPITPRPGPCMYCEKSTALLTVQVLGTTHIKTLFVECDTVYSGR